MTLLDVSFGGPKKYYIAPQIDAVFDSFSKYNPEDLSELNTFVQLKYKNYEIRAGEGSYESSGWVYICEPEYEQIVWLLFFENSSAFVDIVILENQTILKIINF